MGLILGSIEKAFADIRNNARYREDLMYGSMVAGLAFGNADVTAVHCISEYYSRYCRSQSRTNRQYLWFEYY